MKFAVWIGHGSIKAPLKVCYALRRAKRRKGLAVDWTEGEFEAEDVYDEKGTVNGLRFDYTKFVETPKRGVKIKSKPAEGCMSYTLCIHKKCTDFPKLFGANLGEAVKATLELGDEDGFITIRRR